MSWFWTLVIAVILWVQAVCCHFCLVMVENSCSCQHQTTSNFFWLISFLLYSQLQWTHHKSHLNRHCLDFILFWFKAYHPVFDCFDIEMCIMWKGGQRGYLLLFFNFMHTHTVSCTCSCISEYLSLSGKMFGLVLFLTKNAHILFSLHGCAECIPVENCYKIVTAVQPLLGLQSDLWSLGITAIEMAEGKPRKYSQQKFV